MMLRFEPDMYASSNYQLEPDNWMTRVSLSLVLCMKDLKLIVHQASIRAGYGDTDRGFGLDDYPIRLSKAGFVRWWRWDYVEKKDEWGRRTGKHRIKTRKFHLPEAIYMGVLAGVLRAHGWLEDTQQVEAMMAADRIDVRYAPRVYDRFNYRFKTYSRDHDNCLHYVLELQDLERTRALALRREDFDAPWPADNKIGQAHLQRYGVNGKSLRYQDNGTLMLHWPNATSNEVNETIYLDVLEQVLTMHDLETIRHDASPMPTLLYEPLPQDLGNYLISPRTTENLAALESIVHWPRLEEIAQIALAERGFITGYRSREGTAFSFQDAEAVLTFRHGRSAGGWEIRIGKANYLAVLVAVLKARGEPEYAQRVAALMLFEPVEVQWRPDPYLQANYQITPFDARALDCLCLILCSQSLEQIRDEARNRQGFMLEDDIRFGLEFRDGRVELNLPNGTQRSIPESLYLNILEQVLTLHGLEGHGLEKVSS